MSNIRIFKCQQCQHEQALDTVFNFEVCPRCGGNFFPIDAEPPVDWKLRAERAEADLKTCQDGNVELLQEKWAYQQSLVQLMNVLAELVNAVKRGDALGGPEMENALDAIRKGV